LAAVAFTCFKLLCQRTKSAKCDKQKHNIFSPKEKKKKEQKKKKKICKLKAMERRLSRFFEKKYYPKRSAGVEIFFKNPQGLTFTAGKRNC
jgi:hypothetical protein